MPASSERHVVRTIARAVAMAVATAAPITAGRAAAEPPPEVVPPPAAASGGVGDPPAVSAPGSTALDTPAGRLGYALGLRIGGRIAADFKARDPGVDRGALARGVADAILGARPLLGERELAATLEGFEARMREEEKEFGRRMAETAKANAAKGEEFLRANGRKEGVVTLPSGLQYQVLTEGTGEKPRPTDTVSTRYRGTHLDGSEFDGTDPEGDPATFPLRGVVPGWQEALPLMRVGSKWRLFIPPDLAYGAEGSPPVIEPNEVLVFEIELVRIAPR